MCNRNLSPDFWNLRAPTLQDFPFVPLEDGVIWPVKRNPTNNQRNTTRNLIQSTTGVKTLEETNPLDSSQRNEEHTCADIEVPRIKSSIPTAHSVGSNSAGESDMESVDVSSEDESDDGWSVISDDSDFVVVDSAENTPEFEDQVKEETISTETRLKAAGQIEHCKRLPRERDGE